MQHSRWLAGALVALLPLLGWAATPPIEASMVVTGTITVNPDGSVKGYTLDKPHQLPAGARQILQATIPQWQFQPVVVDGKATTAETGMSVRIVADVHKKTATLRVAGAQFGCYAYQAKSELRMACAQGRVVEPVRGTQPAYPLGALRAGMGGEVFLTIRVDRNGHVSRAAVSQVNLYARTDDPAPFRKALTESAVAAALKWTFRVPTIGPAAAQNYWIVQGPIEYTIVGPSSSHHKYGEWTAYLPGPKTVIPWGTESSKTGAYTGGDALARAGVPFAPDTRFILKTSLSGNASHS